jgi:transposase InsO family protein
MIFKYIAEAKKNRSGDLGRLTCKLRVSRSGYFKFKKNQDKKDRDFESFMLISNVFYACNERSGSRTIKMLLENERSIKMSINKIRRIKNKYNLKTKIRRSKVELTKKIVEKQEHKVHPNYLNRDFKRSTPDEVYVTDITQINFGKKQKAFLAVFKDLCTKEIVSYELSTRSDLNLVDIALDKALDRLTKKEREKLMIHSDQGFQFTHKKFSRKLELNGITQSMSRRGNCLDNACVESFFGHFKDWLDVKKCETFEKLKLEVDKEMKFYNELRPQWSLNKKPPRLYRGFVLNNF